MTPGSPDAIAAGCLCPIMDNAHGKGFPVNGETRYWINGDCPMHATTNAARILGAMSKSKTRGAIMRRGDAAYYSELGKRGAAKRTANLKSPPSPAK